MVEVAKHESKRSVSRLLGQYLDAAGKPAGAPIECQFAHIFAHQKRTKMANGKPNKTPHFSVAVKVPKLHQDPTQCTNYAAIAAHCMEAATKAWGSWPQGGKWPIQNGDVPYEQKPQPGVVPLTPEQIVERNKWRVGHWIIECTNYLEEGPRVAVVQNGVEVPITAQRAGGTEFYKSGDHGYIFLGAWTFHNETFGTNFGFDGLCFTRPGERIGAGPKSVASMFGGVGAGVGAGMAAPGPTGPAPNAMPALPQSASAPLPPGAPAAPPAPMAPPVHQVAPPAPPAAPPAPPLAPPPGAAGMPALPVPGR